MMNKLYFLFALAIIACNTPPLKQEEIPNYDHLPKTLLAGLEAHGGIEKWYEMQTLEYDLIKDSIVEHQLIDLASRKVLITTEPETFTLGFNGQEVWVSPEKAAFPGNSARFYHNLLFYFYAMPFIASDPGINYEEIPNDSLNGEVYNAVKISYNEGVGDAPDDEYILYFDKETHQMEWLLYTVTYFSGEKSTKYRAINYSKWQDLNGLLLPEIMTGYKFENSTIGDKRYDRVFNNAKISTEAADQNIFKMPNEAEIDSLIM
ncbi:MAG: DUF6503 family protein [Bacteroidota bacterium]